MCCAHFCYAIVAPTFIAICNIIANRCHVLVSALPPTVKADEREARSTQINSAPPKMNIALVFIYCAISQNIAYRLCANEPSLNTFLPFL